MQEELIATNVCIKTYILNLWTGPGNNYVILIQITQFFHHILFLYLNICCLNKLRTILYCLTSILVCTRVPVTSTIFKSRKHMENFGFYDFSHTGPGIQLCCDPIQDWNCFHLTQFSRDGLKFRWRIVFSLRGLPNSWFESQFTPSQLNWNWIAPFPRLEMVWMWMRTTSGHKRAADIKSQPLSVRLFSELSRGSAVIEAISMFE